METSWRHLHISFVDFMKTEFHSGHLNGNLTCFLVRVSATHRVCFVAELNWFAFFHGLEDLNEQLLSNRWETFISLFSPGDRCTMQIYCSECFIHLYHCRTLAVPHKHSCYCRLGVVSISVSLFYVIVDMMLHFLSTLLENWNWCFADFHQHPLDSVFTSRPCMKKKRSFCDHNTSFTVADLKLLKWFCNHNHHCVSVFVITTACCTWTSVFFAIIICILRK